MKKIVSTFYVLMTTMLLGYAAPKEVAAEVAIAKPKIASAQNINFIPGEGVVIENLLEITATVVDIDKERRVITVVDVDANVTIFNAPSAVQNFDQISVGDSVVLDGYLGLVMLLAQPGQEIESSTITVIDKAKPGEKPAIISAEIIEVLAEITNIDVDTRMVTVTGPKGNFVELIVPEHIDGFEELNVGDKVNTSYAQAFVLSVRLIED